MKHFIKSLIIFVLISFFFHTVFAGSGVGIACYRSDKAFIESGVKSFYYNGSNLYYTNQYDESVTAGKVYLCRIYLYKPYGLTEEPAKA